MSEKEKEENVITEFCNDTTEVHAFAFGLIHSVTRVKPLTYGEIENFTEISPDNRDEIRKEFHYYLGAFWGLRAAVAIAFVALTGAWKLLPLFFGWTF